MQEEIIVKEESEEIIESIQVQTNEETKTESDIEISDEELETYLNATKEIGKEK